MDEQGRAWRREPGERHGGRAPHLDAYVVSDDGDGLTWLARPEHGPTTRKELDEARQRGEAQASEHAKREQAELKPCAPMPSRCCSTTCSTTAPG